MDRIPPAQGVDQFILYDDGSTDDADLIPLLYQAVGLPGTVKVLSSNFLRHSQTSQHTRDQHDANQRSVCITATVVSVRGPTGCYSPTSTNSHIPRGFHPSRRSSGERGM
ncbi:hypothetical protein BV898_10909 [Hypsibius exemplaris]|uniref:Uncharacterized protein n=1 Tax=Hypsibius exemplaris TaxID=2072580 RepID=A0A1W0WI68_HYPEX|nr:hypothetical protein BV898_10909 [Hypsibius exemplaris]